MQPNDGWKRELNNINKPFDMLRFAERVCLGPEREERPAEHKHIKDDTDHDQRLR